MAPHAYDEGCCPAASVAGLEDNTLADGFFHLATWVAVIAGSTLAVRAWQRGDLAPRWRSHVGALLLGWGIFNVVEGLIDHQILGIHHVRDDLGAPLGWDIAFLIFGMALIILGWAMVLAGRREPGWASRRALGNGSKPSDQQVHQDRDRE